jgi:hypothetical protein
VTFFIIAISYFLLCPFISFGRDVEGTNRRMGTENEKEDRKGRTRQGERE